jgi:hypothetical protein
MLSTIFASLGGAIVDKFFGAARDIFHDYATQKISEAECRSRLMTALSDAAKAIEISHSETLAKTFQTFWSAADTDKTNLMKIMWAAALGSQIFVLFWSQWCVPLLFAYGYLPNWKAGTTAEWSYLLIGGLLGLGPVVLRSGPGAGNITDRLKTMVSK